MSLRNKFIALIAIAPIVLFAVAGFFAVLHKHGDVAVGAYSFGLLIGFILGVLVTYLNEVVK